MKVSFVLVPLTAVFLTPSCTAPAPAELGTADIEAIREASAAYTQAASDTAWSRWSTFFTEDAIFLPPNASANEGRAAIEAWGRSLPPITDLRIEPVEIAGNGDLAYARGRYSMTILMPGDPPVADSGKYIELWRRQPGGTWKISRDIFNTDLPLATAEPENR